MKMHTCCQVMKRFSAQLQKHGHQGVHGHLQVSVLTERTKTPVELITAPHKIEEFESAIVSLKCFVRWSSAWIEDF